MSITIDQHSGFCFGVTSAIRTAEKELPRGVLYCLGDIVHNGQEVARLERLGLQTISHEQLQQLPAQSRVLLRAHGEPPATYDIARQQDLHLIDATCPVVKKLQERIRACYEQHKDDENQPPQIVIYGQPGHAEVIGLQGQTDNTAIVIESAEQIERLDFTRAIYLFSQTTKSVAGFQSLVEAIQKHISIQEEPGQLEAHDTICRNVANRVQQLQDFARANDMVIFVGGKKSSNAQVLFRHCLEANPHTLFVSSPDELTPSQTHLDSSISSSLRLGICGATSTPLWLMEACRDKLIQTTQQ